MDTASSAEEEKFLPKEPMDLPLPEKELPAHATEPHQEEQHNPYAVKTLLSWTAPGRPYRKRGKEYFASLVFITILLQIILFLFSEYLLMVLVLSLLFVAVALAVVPPHNITYKITTEGIIIDDRAYLWQELYDFYFKKRNGVELLHIQTYAMIPGQITLILGDIHTEQIKAILLPFLPYREVVRPTFTEKSANWLSKTFPLEKTKE